MMITSDTNARSCGKPRIRSKRLRAYETSPVLCTTLRPDSDSERGSCSEEEREMGIQGNLLAREADTTLRPSDVSETHEVETPSVVDMDESFPQGFMGTSDTLKSNQDLDSGGVESMNTIQEDVPVALRTRSRYQLQHPTEAMKNEDLLDRLQIEAELKELLKQLIIQNKNQQDKIQEMNFTLKAVLEMQITSLQDVQSNIVAFLQNDYQEKFDTISIPSSISDH